MEIRIVRDTETLRYAAEELAKYLMMMDASITPTILVNSQKSDSAVMLGLLSDLSLSDGDVTDAMIDDVIDVNVSCLTGYIAGSNERSVLMGVYHYFKSAGCRWVRPGENGEYIPQKSMRAHAFRERQKAAYPFRGQCIEGAVSFEHVRDTILWLPKVDMNLFMIEQIVPYNYMNRWYRHTGNTKLQSITVEPPYSVYCDYVSAWEQTIKQCGLQFHALGHGATNEPFGVRHMISGQHYDVSEETKQAFALVKGKRELFESSPFFTQLCMSQEWIQDKVVAWLADYLDEKPYIDFLHFWLADNKNNHCECEKCVKSHPSDLYVQMLNKLDAELSKRGNPAKIVFIMYVATLWPPIKEKLNNPSRFILTTATTRAAGDQYSDKRRESGIPEWIRNKHAIEAGFDLTLSFLDAWKPVFDGPKFLFEYFLYTSHFQDPGYMTFSRRLITDMKMLPLTSFNGIMSDQTQRSFFPTGLPATILGELQFDPTQDGEAYITQYFKDSFGAEWELAKDYLESVSRLFSIDALAQNSDVTAQDTGAEDVCAKKASVIGNRALQKGFLEISSVSDAFSEVVKAHLDLSDKCHKESWRILSYHTEYCKRLATIYLALTENDTAQAHNNLSDMIDYLSEIEEEIHPYFDLVLFTQRTRQLIEGK